MFIKNDLNFLKISQEFVFFFQTREKLTHGLFNFFEKYAKIMHFPYFLQKFFENSPASGGLRPPDPIRGRPPKVFPPSRNPGGAAVYGSLL